MTTTARLTFPLVALVSAACTTATGSQPDGAPPRPVRVATVIAASSPPAVRYSATFEAQQQVAVAFKASGYVDHVVRRAGADGRMRLLQAGDVVARGALLAHVQDADYRDRVNQSEARLAEGTAALTKARVDLDRARTLFSLDSLTKPELDAAQAALDTAEARTASARAEVNLATSSLGDVSLVAPSSGTVLDRRIEVGSLANAGTVAFTLADLSALKATFGVPDAMVGSVSPGAALNVVVEAIGGKVLAGRVTAVAPAADPQGRVFDVDVTVPNPDGRLRPGMIGTVAFDVRAPSSAPSLPAVPLGAVVKPEGAGSDFAVFVVESNGASTIARRRALELGDVAGNGVVVRSGLSPGERVVVAGASLLTDGEPIRIIP